MREQEAERKQIEKTALDSAFGKAKEALDKLSGCAGVFGSPTVFGTLTMTAGTVLQTLVKSNAFHFARGTNFPFKNGGVTSYNETVIAGVRVSWSASITLDPALIDNPTELALTMIHEAGHVLRGLGFTGGDFNDDDGPNQPDNQQHNNDRIREECNKK